MTTPSLYARLGQTAGIEALVADVVSRHLANPAIAKRFEPVAADPAKLTVAKRHLVHFLEAGSGGPVRYEGRSMPEAHAGMNISGGEYLAAIDDIMGALSASGATQETQKDVLFIAYSLSGEIVGR